MIVTSWGHDHGEVGPGWVLGSSWNRSSQFEVDHRESEKQKAWETGREKLRQKNQVGYRSICFWGGWWVVRVSFSCFSCLAFFFFFLFFWILESRENGSSKTWTIYRERWGILLLVDDVSFMMDWIGSSWALCVWALGTSWAISPAKWKFMVSHLFLVFIFFFSKPIFSRFLMLNIIYFIFYYTIILHFIIYIFFSEFWKTKARNGKDLNYLSLGMGFGLLDYAGLG